MYETMGQMFFDVDILSSISQADGDISMKPIFFLFCFHPSFEEIFARFFKIDWEKNQ